MYDIKQFRPAMYLLILLGFAGYGLAAETPGLWAFCTLLVVANAWFIKIDLFKPMPRLMASFVTVVCFAYVFLPAAGRSTSLILVAGQILVLLQVVKVWEQRGNRDYAQLLVLSLLLMVAAAISTASLFFGVIFLTYLLLSLYCCLLFHLKVETDEARKAMALPEDRLNPATLRQDQRHLPSSMRRLTGLVAAFSITFAVMVFLLFPRGPGAGLFGQMQVLRTPDPLTGFSDHVDFQTVAKITQNESPVAQVQLFKDDKPLGFIGTILLRGATHDLYNGSDNSAQAAYQWNRTPTTPFDISTPDNFEPKEALRLQPTASQEYLEKVEVSPTGTSAIFSIAGPDEIIPETTGSNRSVSLRYSPMDETLAWSDAPQQRAKYSIYYSGNLNKRKPDAFRVRSKIDPQIAAYALLPEVSGGLAQQRQSIAATQPYPEPTPVDEQIARNIESHLKTSFQYTLDLTDTHRMKGRDPIVAFLYEFKKGHCEYFAGAMTLLCQSLGMDARMVVGFKCDEFNPIGHYYNVRQSHAHAWVEVLTTNGWETFDPTSGREAPVAQAGLWQRTMQLVEYMEYTWQNAVIAYDADNRGNLIQEVDVRIANTSVNSASAFTRAQKWLVDKTDVFANRIVAPLIATLALALLGSIAWFLYERIKLQRRASRIGIQFLPASDQSRLVRQLAFYDDMLQLLERHRLPRPAHLTPLEFSNSLSFLPSETYDTIRRLTGLFYRIRFGHTHLSADQQRRLTRVVARLNPVLPMANGTLR